MNGLLNIIRKSKGINLVLSGMIWRSSFCIRVQKLSLCIFLFLLSFQAFPIDKNILVIHSYHQGLEWTDSISSGILLALNNQPDIRLYFEYMDTKRNTSKAYYDNLIELYRSRSSKIQYDAVIVVDNAAYDFMVGYRDEFFPGVPVFFCGVNFLDTTKLQSHKDFHGFAEMADHVGTLDLIKKLFPERKKVLIVNDYTLTGIAIREELEQVLPKYKDELEFEIIDTFSTEELQERVARLTNEYTIYILVVNMDRKGNYISYNQGIKLIRERTSVPILGSWDFYLGKGIIGGDIIRGVEQGKEVGNLTYDFITKRNTNPPKWQSGSTNFWFDDKLLEQYSIRKQNLPEGARIINLPKLANWQIFWLKVLIIIILLLALGFYVYNRREQAIKLKKLVELRTQELKDINTELEIINQSKNEILSIVAHDLRNPIGNVNGFAQLILENDEEEKVLNLPNQTYITQIRDLSNYMLRLVNNLLDISVIESGVLKLEIVDADYVDFIKEEVLNNRALADQYNIAIDYQCPEEKIMVCFDRMKMQQAVNNLISNALKFSKEGDSILISVKMEAKKVITSVIDSGCGIPKDKFDMIFKKYTQIKSTSQIQKKGTGLGLSIVKGIIDAHKGRIYLKSIVNEGTEFIFELPVSAT
ncbi:MAG TPA: HAMP domain-containing sensor histidine kinase [Prolixibacteraceae bacterium]|nr:HAMP domain-containing sensor histidine kinase [Prolixibacteraceae bacterium]